MYADYEYYITKFGILNPFSADLTEDIYTTLAIRAKAYIDNMTMNRIKDMEEIPESVKMAFCAIVDVLLTSQYAKRNIAEGNGDISSEKTGEESVNYSYGRLTKQAGMSISLDSQLKEAVRLYLTGTGLLYRGVR